MAALPPARDFAEALGRAQQLENTNNTLRSHLARIGVSSLGQFALMLACT